MFGVKRALPLATAGVLLTAGSFVVATEISVQADTAHATHAKARQAAATATPDAGEGAPDSGGTSPDSGESAPDAGKGRIAAKTPEQLLQILGERIKAKDVNGIIALHEPEAAIVNYDLSVIRGHKDIRAFYVDWFKADPVLTVDPGQVVIAGGKRGLLDGKVHRRTAAIMGKYTLEQKRADGTRESFTGNFCDTVQEQPNGTWLYVQDNPYPPHGGATSAGPEAGHQGHSAVPEAGRRGR